MRTKIVSYKDYVTGWLDTSVHEILEALPPTAVSTKFARVTCLDSHPEPASLIGKSPELKSIANKLETLGTGLLLPTKLLLRTDSASRLFFGFD